jgi:hypothetical protein
VDWEAILSQDPAGFRAAVGSWLYPPQARGEPAPAGEPAFPPAVELPQVSELLDTMRARLEALNGPDARRVF